MLSTNITTPVHVRVLRVGETMQENDVDEEGESLEVDTWVKGVALESYICSTMLQLMYKVQLNDEILQVPFFEIETL